MKNKADYRYMARAIQLAKKGWFTTHPNPRVGCVLAKDGQLIGEGYHRKAGELHAERVALANATQDPAGSTAYVTLEPCCHHGKTPPCTDGLIEAGVSRVVIAMQDPNPLVAGKGVEALQNAGIEVDSGLLETQAIELNKGFIKRMKSGLPYVRCKLASSLDGRTAMASGESVWISSEHSRRDVQFLRAGSSAILTGIGTVLHDNPSLNVRLNAENLNLDGDLDVPQPLRVILDPELETPAGVQMLHLPGEIVIFCQHEFAEQASKYAQQNVTVKTVDGMHGQLNLKQVLNILAEKQVNDVFLEAGATLAGAAVEANLVDELIVYQANHLMGDTARGLLRLTGLESMDDRIRLNLIDERRFGDDRRLTFSLASK